MHRLVQRKMCFLRTQHVARVSPESGKIVLYIARSQLCKVEDQGHGFIRSKHNSGWKEPLARSRVNFKAAPYCSGPHITEFLISLWVRISHPLWAPVHCHGDFFPLYLTRISLAAACPCCCLSFTGHLCGASLPSPHHPH